jgi:hypothetical protein
VFDSSFKWKVLRKQSPDFREHPEWMVLAAVDVGGVQQGDVAGVRHVRQVPDDGDLLLDVDHVGVGLPVAEDHLGGPDVPCLVVAESVQGPILLQVQIAEM